MNWSLSLDKNSIKPVYIQIKENCLKAIEEKALKTGDSIPSINKLCAEHQLAPGTVIRAYEELKEMGVISSKQGKGFFVANTNLKVKNKIFLLFDRMNTYKEILYESFLDNLEKETEVNVFFHHYDLKRFEKLIREKQGKYSHYVLMPHLNEDVSKIIARIPEKKLILIDNLPPETQMNVNAVFQDFENDIFNGLHSYLEKIRSYRKIWLSLSKSRFQFVPDGCIQGFRKFCEQNGFLFEITQNIEFQKVSKNELYIVFSDIELINFIKSIKERNWQIGNDIGLISYDDTPVKEILESGISVLSTDFKMMGKTVAEIVAGKKEGQIANSFQLIHRNSF